MASFGIVEEISEMDKDEECKSLLQEKDEECKTFLQTMYEKLRSFEDESKKRE